MNLLFYVSTTDEATNRLQKVVETVLPGENREIYRDIQSLSKRLREPPEGRRIAVLLASNRQDLSAFESIRNLLSDLPIILVLPDRKIDTITQGHTLRPRFLTYMDSDFVELAGVLLKMARAPAPTEISKANGQSELGS